MKQILKLIGINTFMAVKVAYDKCVNANDFYRMLSRRLQYSKPKELAEFLRHELHFHYKEYAQYQ